MSDSQSLELNVQTKGLNLKPKKILPYVVGVILVLNLGRMVYSDFQKNAPEKELKQVIEQHFTDGDERIEMTWYKAQGKTISLALKIKGITRHSKDIEKLKDNSRNFVYDKVCNSDQLRNFLDAGNLIIVDIRDSAESRPHNVVNIMNVTMTASKCS